MGKMHVKFFKFIIPWSIIFAKKKSRSKTLLLDHLTMAHKGLFKMHVRFKRSARGPRFLSKENSKHEMFRLKLVMHHLGMRRNGLLDFWELALRVSPLKIWRGSPEETSAQHLKEWYMEMWVWYVKFPTYPYLQLVENLENRLNYQFCTS